MVTTWPVPPDFIFDSPISSERKSSEGRARLRSAADVRGQGRLQGLPPDAGLHRKVQGRQGGGPRGPRAVLRRLRGGAAQDRQLRPGHGLGRATLRGFGQNSAPQTSGRSFLGDIGSDCGDYGGSFALIFFFGRTVHSEMFA